VWIATASVLFIGVFLIDGLYQYKNKGAVFLYSIDFTGGTQVLLKTSSPLSVDNLRANLADSGWSSVDVRAFGNNEYLVKIQDFASDVKGLGKKIQEKTQELIPEGTVELLQSEAVGPGVGESLRTKSLQAIVVALILMLLYIAFRFWSFAFAIGAVVALLHDAIAMLAMLFFFKQDISMNVIGAMLAVLGYSINDTIVIFSRIRQDIARHQGQPLEITVNESINRTLTRTILTSLSTILPVLAMFFFGGEALHSLSFVLVTGILFGTYSSIYIASPVMMLFYGEKK
jgi:preprotein translocase subunit SecF